MKLDCGEDTLLVEHPAFSALESSVPRSAVTVIQEPIEVGDFIRGLDKHGIPFSGVVVNLDMEIIKIRTFTGNTYPLLRWSARLICKAANLEEGWDEYPTTNKREKK